VIHDIIYDVDGPNDLWPRGLDWIMDRSLGKSQMEWKFYWQM